MTSDTLYHYTNASGLLGILERRELWCTHVSYLNDTLEYKHGYNTYRDVLKAICAAQDEAQTMRLAAERTLAVLDGHISSNALLEDPRRYYVASFSSVPDDLSQWRGYGGSGPRFAIGFSKTELQKLHAIADMRLEQVSYDTVAAQTKMRLDFVRGMKELIEQHSPPGNFSSEVLEVRPAELWRLSNSLIDSVSPLLKHEKFAAESEWRLFGVTDMRRPPPQARFRGGRSFLIPYIAVDLDVLDKPISNITVGPTPYPVEARAAVERMLAFQKVPLTSGRNVVSSSIPYRDW